MQSLKIPSTPKSDLEKLLEKQRETNSLVKAVLQYKDSYLVFLYTEKQLHDISQFCCGDNDVAVLGIDTTFNLCHLWVTDTSYRNKRLANRSTQKSPVNVGPTMLHFTKDDETFRRFCAEMLCSNPQIVTLQKVGVDMEKAIFNGFKSLLPKLMRLLCVRHLSKRDEVSIEQT